MVRTPVIHTVNWCRAGKVTPYSVGATEAFDMVYNGGKEDDITVVVARFEGEFVTGSERGLGRHGL